MAVLFSEHFQSINASGVPVSGAKLNFYSASSTTPITVYQDGLGSTPWTQPVVADASGLFPPIYLVTDFSNPSAGYKIVLTDSGGTVIQTVDRIQYGVGVNDYYSAGGLSALELDNPDSGSAIGPIIIRLRSSSTPAASDLIGGDFYRGRNSSAANADYATVQVVINDPVDGTEDGDYQIKTLVAGTNAIRFSVTDRPYYIDTSANRRTLPYQITGSATYDPPSLIDGAGVTTTVTCTGAALGDIAVASFSLDLQGILVTAYVDSANSVSVRFQNETTGTLNLASGTLKVAVYK